MATIARTQFRNWFLGRTMSPVSIQLCSDQSHGRIFLSDVAGVGRFVLHGLKKGAMHSLSFRNEIVGHGFSPTINKVLIVEELGSHQPVPLYLRQDENIYFNGRPVKYNAKALALDLRLWFDGKRKTPPLGIRLKSNNRGELFLGSYKSKSFFVGAKLQPETEYNLDFGQKGNDLYCRVSKTNGTLIDLYYLRYNDKFCNRARPKKISARRSAEQRSIKVRDFLEGNGTNPGRLAYKVYDDGEIRLCTLSDGSYVRLRGLGKGKRSAKLEFKQDKTGNVIVCVYEKQGLLNNWYIVRQAEEIMLAPLPQLAWQYGKFVPEVAQIKDWLATGAGKTVSCFQDSFAAVWFAHCLREQTGREISLSYVMHKLWLEKKIPRQALHSFSMLASYLDLFFSLPGEIKALAAKDSSVPEFFDRLWQIRGQARLVSVVSALFVGGILGPRKRKGYYEQLAQAYEVAQDSANKWLRQAPDFNNDFAGAVAFLIRNHKGNLPLNLMILALGVQGKLSLQNIKLNSLALGYIRRNLDLIEEKEGVVEQSFVLNTKGKKYPQKLEALIVFLIRQLFAEDLSLVENFRAIPVSLPKQRQEAALYGFAKEAPAFDNPFAMTEWLIENRVADYSLRHHVDYLLYCQKIPEERAAGFVYLANAYTYFLLQREQIITDIKAAIEAVPRELYPTPHLIRKEILKTKNWRKRGKDEPVGESFVYLVVLAAFRLNWQELYPQVKKHQQGRDKMSRLGRVFVQTGALSSEQTASLQSIEEKRFAAGRQLLMEEETDTLVALSRLGYKKAQDYLIYFYLPLLKARAQKWAVPRMPFEELLQIAQIKFLLLSQKFDPSFGTKFMTYVFANLDWYLFVEVRRETGAIYRPAHYINEMKKINRTRDVLRQELGRNPHDEELARTLDIEVDELRTKMSLAIEIKSMSDRVGHDTEFEKFLADPAMQVEEAVVADSLRAILERAIAETKSLSDSERNVLTMRYLRGRIYTLEEVGQELSLTKERIRQIQQKAFTKLFKGRFSSGLRLYLD